MVAILPKLLRRELKKNWFEYVSMLLITVLAVTLFLGFLSNSLTLRRRADKYFKAAALCDLVVFTSAFSQDDRAVLEKAETASTEYRLYASGSFIKEGRSATSAEIFVSDTVHNAPYVTSGRVGVLVDARTADVRGYAVGDAITVDFASLMPVFAALGLESSTLEFTVTGLMHSVERVNTYAVSPLFLSPDAFAEALAAATGLPKAALRAQLPALQNQAVITCKDPAAVKKAVGEYFAAKPQNNLLFIYDRDTMEAVVTIDEEVRQSLHMLYVFPVIFFFVALLIIMATVSRLILRERTNIGTMKALGFSNRRIVFQYAFFSMLITLFGCIAGAIAGPCILPRVMGIKYSLMFSMPQLAGIAVSIPFSLLCTAVVCLSAAVIAVVVCYGAVRENPASCMRPKATEYRPKARRSQNARGKFASCARLSMNMALRNVRINWKRSLLTTVGILGCTALLLTSFGIGDTLNNSIESDLGRLFRYDVASSYLPARQQATEEKLHALKEDGTVRAYERLSTYNATVDGSRNVQVIIFSPDSAMTDVLKNGNALSKTTADDLGLKKGDVIAFTLGNCRVEYTIDCIVQTSVFNGFFTTQNKFTADCYCSQTVWVLCDDPQQVKNSLNEVNGTHNAQTMTEKIAEIRSMISSTDTMKYTLMVFAILLSVAVLYNLSMLNLKEHMRDMATLKVLGFKNGQIALSLIAEIMLLTLVGTALGCFVGYPLLSLVMYANRISVMAFIIRLKPFSYLLSVLLSIGTALIINFLFSLPIRKINMTESLKSVE